MKEKLEYGKVYEVILSDRRESGPIKMVYVGISPIKPRTLKRIFLAKPNGEIIAYRIGEDYELRGETLIAKRSSNIKKLLEDELQYIEEKELLKDL